MPTAIRLQSFSGEIPQIGNRLMPDGNAQVAYNVLLTAGQLEPLYYPKAVSATLRSGTVKSIYRMYDSADVSSWLNWTSDVDVARLPISGDTSFRVAFTSEDFEPRITNYALATSAAPYPTAWYVFGVTPPTVAPTVAIVGGSGATETRAYVYTFVTAWGEESAPSPASTAATGFANGSWDLSALQTAPGNSYAVSAASWSGGYLTCTVPSTFGLRAKESITLSGFAPAALNASFRAYDVPSSTTFRIAMSDPGTITDQVGTATRDAPHNTTSMVKRIYRTVTTSSTTAYFYVGETAVANTTYSDTATTIGEEIATSGWAMPPADLQGLQTLPCGAMVGFSGNLICFSEPSSVYAWPQSYQLTLDFPIIGIGVFGDSVVAATSGQPYVAQGTEPAAMTRTKVDEVWPCLDKRGVVNLGYGVAYPCPQGLAIIGTQGADLLTRGLYTFREWAEIAPDTFIGTMHDGRYYAGYTLSDGSGGMLVLDKNSQAAVTRANQIITAIYTDKKNGKLYIINGGILYEWNADLSARMVLDWWSKEYISANPINLGAAKFDADFETSQAEAAALLAAQLAQQAANAAAIAAETTGGSLNGAAFNTYSLNGSSVKPVSLVGSGATAQAQFTLYANNEVVYNKTVTDNRAFRLPAGIKYDNFSFRIGGNVVVKGLVVAETMQGLKGA